MIIAGVAVVAAVASAVLSGAAMAATTMAMTIALTVASVAVGIVGAMLSKPKVPSYSDYTSNQDRKQVLRSSTAADVVIYGHVVTSGLLFFAEEEAGRRRVVAYVPGNLRAPGRKNRANLAWRGQNRGLW